MSENSLYYGDNLDVLRRYIAAESIDLIYLDPPFKSDQDYNVLFEEQNGSKSKAQVRAFEDTWRWDPAAEASYDDVLGRGGRVAEALRAFRVFLGSNDMMAYLAMMAPRLVELRRVLKKSGSLYLHCDPTASHYLKLLLDAVFGIECFKNEIIWRRTGAHGPRRTYGPIHDTILFYSVDPAEYFFRVARTPYMRGHVQKRYRVDKSGRLKFITGGNILTGAGTNPEAPSGKPWRGFNPSKKNRHWAVPGYLVEQMTAEFKKLGVLEQLEELYRVGLIEINEAAEWPLPVKYLEKDDGHPLQDIWAYQSYTEGTVHGTEEGIDADVQWLGPTSPERLHYPTQKPIGLLKRIIATSCPEGGVVLDPFCGCGTTIEAAEEMRRKWVGIDITHLAIGLIKHRLLHPHGLEAGKQYLVTGEPTDLEGARQLAKEDPYQFQWWALGLVGARRSEQKKGSDKGIDGRLYFHDDREGSKTKQIIISVKSGHVSVSQVRDLRGVVEREEASVGVLISLEDPTQPMRTEASAAGFYHSLGWGKKYRRLQLLTIPELLQGAAIDYPPARQVNVTFKKAKKGRRGGSEHQNGLFEEG